MFRVLMCSLILLLLAQHSLPKAIIADHQCTEIESIPIAAIQAAKETLHIGYGHTSHGSQITSGMSGLVEFMNSKGYPHDLFAWNHSGSNGALHLYEGDGYGDGDLDHDAGYYPNWVDETRAYLGEPTPEGRGNEHPEINVIMWSWCGQLSWYSSDDVQSKYLDEMARLESDYPDVIFVYMTGHADGSGLEGTLHKNNQQIRQFCVANDKVLFDFYDIECYDPDGNYYGDKHVSDDCSYDGGNWAQEWQNSHDKGVDWYECGSAHSQPLNANQKAYAIWWMWARLAGWDGDSGETAVSKNAALKPARLFKLYENAPNPFNHATTIRFELWQQSVIDLIVYNAAGKIVYATPPCIMSAGEHILHVDLRSRPSGMYYYRLSVDGQGAVGRMVLLR